jgi:hypothetical protein
MNDILKVFIFIAIAIFVFWLVSQNFMYKLTQDVTHLLGWTSSVDGKPNTSGLILHGVVLALLLALAGYFLLMK